MKRLFRNFQKKVTALLIVSIITLTVGFAPIDHNGNIHKVEALLGGGGGPVWVVGGNGTIQETISAGANVVTAALQDAFFIKEFTLDGILHGLAKMVLKSMTQSLLNWINSGFQGSPAFVSDLKQFIRDRIDTVVGEYIYNDPALNFLCSPFQLDVKIALATEYQQEAHDGTEAQCTLSQVTDNIEGFLSGQSFDPAAWFEVTQNPSNTPTGALLEARGEMYARIVDEEGRTINELEWGDGFLSFKVCADTDVASGAQTDCDIVTPGQVIADQINKSLGAGQDALIEADEINEIIGALFAQLAQQAITGIYGLLGLGGGTGYSDNRFGDGSQSYLDALGEEGTGSEGVDNPLETAITRQEEYLDLNNEIIDQVNNIETYYNTVASRWGSDPCFNLDFSSSLEDEREVAIDEVIASNQIIPVLEALRDAFASSTDPQEQLDIVNTYEQMRDNGLAVDFATNNLLEVHVDYELRDEIDEFRNQVNQADRRCEQANSN